MSKCLAANYARDLNCLNSAKFDNSVEALLQSIVNRCLLLLLLCYLTDMNSAQNRRCPTTVFGCEVCFRFQQFILCDLNRNLAHIFSWHVFRSWGRVGTSIGGTKLETFRSVDNAIENFNEVYFDKTGTFVMMVD